MDVLPANCYLFIYLFNFACRFFFPFPPMRSLVSKGTVMGKKSLSLFPAPALLRLNFLPHLCTLLWPQQVLHTLLCLETPSERAIKQRIIRLCFFCLLCVLCSESGHYTVNILACVAWRFCRAGRRSGVAARKLLPPKSPRSFSALARLYYLARPTKTAMLRRLFLKYFRFSWSSTINNRTVTKCF